MKKNFIKVSVICNHSTVSTSYKKVQKMIQEDRTVTEDLKSLRDKITLRS